MLVFDLQWLSLHWKILITWLSQFILLSVKLKKGCPISSHSLWLFSYLIETILIPVCDHLRDVLWEDMFKLSASAAASEFCEWVRTGNDVYIPDFKYQVKTHSSPWFSAAWVSATVRNHFFCLHQQNKSSEFKTKFRQACNRFKRVLEDARLVYANKTIRVHYFPETWLSALLANC